MLARTVRLEYRLSSSRISIQHRICQRVAWQPNLCNGGRIRIFTTEGNLKKQNTDLSSQNKQTPASPAVSVSGTPKRGDLEAIQTRHPNSERSTQKQDLLGSTSVVAKEQRRADWAI